MVCENSTSPSVRLEFDPKAGNRLTVQTPDGDIDRYDVSFRACPSPVCWCESVDLVCTPLDESTAEESGPRLVALDLHERGPQEPLHETEQVDIPLTRSVAAGLSPEHWRRLRAWLAFEKRRAMEDMDLDALDPNFPPAVTTDGNMVSYDEVFPFAEPLTFSVDDKAWVADDQYCVQPECRCNEAFFCFFPLSGVNAIDDDQQGYPIDQGVEVAAAAVYDIRKRSWEVQDDPPVSSSTARTLTTALGEKRPDFPAVVAERRRQLRHLYRRWIERHAEPRSRPVVAAPKIGRNLPCPCGSGKKYKRCCGR